MNSALLARPMPSSLPQSKRSSKQPSMVLAHFNKHELEELDHAQGGKEIDSKTGIRQYKRLGDAFKNPELQQMTITAARQSHAAGGSIASMMKQGRKGDTEMAFVPTHLADHFDKMMGKRSINPHTGHREYYDFSSLASGLGNFMGGFNGGAQAPGGSLGSAPATGGAPAGGGWGSMLGSLASSFMQPKAPPAGGAPSGPGAQSQGWGNAGMNGLTNGLISMLQARQGGGSWQDAMKQGALSGAGSFAQQAPISSLFGGGAGGQGGGYMSQFMSNPYAQAGMNGLRGAANSYMQGNGFQNALSQGLNQGLSSFGDNPYARAAQTGVNAYQNGGGWQDALGQAGLQGFGSLADQYGYGGAGNAARGALNARQGGADWATAGKQGAMQGLSGYDNPYATGARAALQTNMNGGNMQDSMVNGGLNGLMAMLQQQQANGANPSAAPQAQKPAAAPVAPPLSASGVPANTASPIVKANSRKRRRAVGGPINSYVPSYR